MIQLSLKRFSLILALAVLATLMGCRSGATPRATATHTRPTPAPIFTSAARRPVSTPMPVPDVRVPRYAVHELSFAHDSGRYANPWDDVTLTVTFTTPSGRPVIVGGFFYDTDVWKVRFAPSELGRHAWRSAFTDAGGTYTETGAFTVAPSAEHGFVRSYAPNPFRWVFDDGTPYHPIGLQDCTDDRDKSGDPFDDLGFDGGFREHNFAIGAKTDLDTYVDAYAAAGFNLWRWTAENCGFRLWERIAPDGNVYRRREGRWGDHLITALRARGFRIYAALFAFHPPFPDERGDGPNLEAVRRYVRYFVNRYAAYVDFWDLMNEANASDEWYASIAGAVRQADPYGHPIATSWERPDLAVIDINSPHWYETEDELESDRVTAERIRSLRPSGKPIIFSEHGNSGVNWDARSATRMRLRAWTAFFEQAALIFWNSSFGKDYHAEAANIYLGPEERGYIRALQNFTAGFDPAALPVAVTTSAPGRLRAYGLRSSNAYAAYLVDVIDHVQPMRGVHVSVDLPVAGEAVWYHPATGEIIATSPATRGPQRLAVPDFVTDIALKVVPR